MHAQLLAITLLLGGCKAQEGPKAVVSPTIDLKQPEAPSAFDPARETTASLEGLRKLFEDLDVGVAPDNRSRAVVVRIAVIQSYLALMTDVLSEEQQKDIKELSVYLYNSIKKRDREEAENPKKDS